MDSVVVVVIPISSSEAEASERSFLAAAIRASTSSLLLNETDHW